jgi:tRNA pseudouridine38-40 synthase
MQTWKLDIEYDGTAYRGWQMQRNARSVQGELLDAAQAVFEQRVELSGAGRTDAGVHAIHQVAHLRVKDYEEDFRPKHLQFALNDKLPHNINVTRIQNAENEFHARFDAVSRTYIYQISQRRTAFGKNYVWWIKDQLNPNFMSQAAESIIGKHNFRSFCEVEDERESTVVNVRHAEIFVDGDVICFRITANHFLWKMVRRLVGTIAEIGRGKLSPMAIDNFLKKPSAIPAKLTAPPSGLFLEKVCYHQDNPPTEQKAVFPIN